MLSLQNKKKDLPPIPDCLIGYMMMMWAPGNDEAEKVAKECGRPILGEDEVFDDHVKDFLASRKTLREAQDEATFDETKPSHDNLLDLIVNYNEVSAHEKSLGGGTRDFVWTNWTRNLWGGGTRDFVSIN